MNLHSAKDGNFESAIQNTEVGLSFGPDVKLNKIELLKVFRKGKLVFPYIKRDISPRLAGLDPVIYCEKDGCYLAQNYHFLTEWNFIPPLGENYSRQATTAELKEFEQVKGGYQQYRIQPTNRIYRALDRSELNPIVYLDFKRYQKRWRFPLNLDEKGDISTPADIAPIVELFSNIKALTFQQKGDKTIYNPMYVQAFQQEKILKRRLTLFNERPLGYESERSHLSVYTGRVWHWDAIIPVGYLEHGSARFIYFYPETDYAPLTKQGQPMIQVLPVSRNNNGYYLDFENLIYSRLSALQFPEAIELAMKFFDPNIPAMEFTENDKMELEREVVQQEVQTPGAGQPEEKAPALSPKIVFAIVVLLMVIVIVVFAIKRRKVSK
ncbi:MAG: hypothetical protein GY702_21535 [Desulfobulbaceae bacterium]|nr:hypothetical protein [Desulfobulbaceae bacterium]